MIIRRCNQKSSFLFCIIMLKNYIHQLLYCCFLQSGTVQTVKIFRGSIIYLKKNFLVFNQMLYKSSQQKTAQRPSSRASGFFRGSLNSMSLNSFACCCGVNMISVVPSGPIRVSTSFFWSLGSQWLSIRIFVKFSCFRNS